MIACQRECTMPASYAGLRLIADILGVVVYRSVFRIKQNFVISGPKLPQQKLKDKAKHILGISVEQLPDELVESVNGPGCCN